jgi:hypothetical protein
MTENLGIKIESKRVSKLTKLRDICEETILDNELDTFIRQACIDAINRKLREDKEKLK